MRLTSISAVLAVALAVAIPAHAQTAAPAANAPLSTSATTIGVLLANPDAKAVLVKHIPTIANNPEIAQAASMTFKDIQQYAAAELTDDILKKIDLDLAKIPAPAAKK